MLLDQSREVKGIGKTAVVGNLRVAQAGFSEHGHTFFRSQFPEVAGRRQAGLYGKFPDEQITAAAGRLLCLREALLVCKIFFHVTERAGDILVTAGIRSHPLCQFKKTGE